MLPPTPPLPPASAGAPAAPAPPQQPPSPEAVLSLLIRDGIVAPQAQHFSFYLASNEMLVNGQPQSAELLARYRQRFGLAKDFFSINIEK